VGRLPWLPHLANHFDGRRVPRCGRAREALCLHLSLPAARSRCASAPANDLTSDIMFTHWSQSSPLEAAVKQWQRASVLISRRASRLSSAHFISAQLCRICMLAPEREAQARVQVSRVGGPYALQLRCKLAHVRDGHEYVCTVSSNSSSVYESTIPIQLQLQCQCLHDVVSASGSGIHAPRYLHAIRARS